MSRSIFTTLSGVCDAARIMRSFAWIVAVLALVLTGCATSRITNLTTTRQPRNASGVYPIEFVWDSHQQTIIDGSIKPYVVIGFDLFPMRPALNIKNRWETVIPVAADKHTFCITSRWITKTARSGNRRRTANFRRVTGSTLTNADARRVPVKATATDFRPALSNPAGCNSIRSRRGLAKCA